MFDSFGWTTLGTFAFAAHVGGTVFGKKVATKLCGAGEDTPFAAALLGLWFEAPTHTVGDSGSR